MKKKFLYQGLTGPHDTADSFGPVQVPISIEFTNLHQKIAATIFCLSQSVTHTTQKQYISNVLKMVKNVVFSHGHSQRIIHRKHLITNGEQMNNVALNCSVLMCVKRNK